ncbi:MAG: hypothetical protein KGO49_05760 [Gammaproteobacteria bacterium]|nr:hypothetical protein [Gammaproteobacteria bacterium]
MKNNGMERLDFAKRLQTSSSTFKRIRTIGILGMVSGGLLLSGCHSLTLTSQTSPQSRYLYDAPAQAFTIDLGAQNFRGDVRLRDSCTPEGVSLNIYDNAGRFFRIDAVNLINNPNIVMPEFADDTTTRDLIFRYYMEKVNPNGRIILQRNVNSRMGAALYAVVQSEITVKDVNQDLNTTRYMGYLITRRGNMGYVLQHEQKFYRSDRMLEILGLLASEIQIPGRLPTNRKQEDNPLYIDLKNSTPQQIQDWKKAAQCGDTPHNGLFHFGDKPASQQPADAPSDKAVDYGTSSDDAQTDKGSIWHRIYSGITFWKK